MIANQVSADLGSPPRVRGIAIGLEGIVPNGRITPACAGNSKEKTAEDIKAQDHPRVCGE